MNKCITTNNVNLEKLGFTNLPKHLTYFKFELGTGVNDNMAIITTKSYACEGDLKEVEKVFKLVEIEPSEENN